MMRASRFSLDQKLEALRRWKTGEATHEQITSELKIGTGTLSAWKAKLKRGGPWYEAAQAKAQPAPAALVHIKPQGLSKDALIFLRHARDTAVADLKAGRVKGLPRSTLYSLLALDALERF